MQSEDEAKQNNATHSNAGNTTQKHDICKQSLAHSKSMQNETVFWQTQEDRNTKQSKT